jgi:hypothetical protein
VVQESPLVATVSVAGGVYLVALLMPVIWHRAWRELTPRFDEPVQLLRRNPKLAARLSVLLAYADGQWLVEVRKGRALLGKRYLIKSTEALNMLSALNLPALTSRVEQALTVDKTEASRQVERMRSELAELEAKLDGLSEMVDLADGAGKEPIAPPQRQPGVFAPRDKP